MSRLAIVALPAVLLAACATSPGDPVDEMDPTEGLCPNLRGYADTCGDLLKEPTFVTLIDRAAGARTSIALVGLTSGNTCELATFSANHDIEHVTSLAVIDFDVFYCAAPSDGAPGQLTRVSMATGAVSYAPIDCLSVASFQEQLVVMTDVGSSVKQYASWDAVLANTPTVTSIGDCGTQLGASEDRLYSSFPTATEVFMFDPASNVSSKLPMMSSIHVDGMAAQKGTLAILDGNSYDHYLYSFDAMTGAPKAKVVASTQVARVHGLSNACQTPALE